MNIGNSSEEYPFEVDLRARSNFVQSLVQHSNGPKGASPSYLAKPPRRIVQFWHDLDHLPQDVKKCIESWKELEKRGVKLLLFDECLARIFIRKQLGLRYERAYNKCYHPAMQSDYFRLCYILTEGGFYVDADEVYYGAEVEHLFDDGRLKMQPLCYDISTDEMVLPSVFTNQGAGALNWLFYFANDPLIAGPGHPIVERALRSATLSLERDYQGKLPEIQATTGPGNLTKSVFEAVAGKGRLENALLVLHDWKDIATTKWSLSYRNDGRNWRLSNRQAHWRSHQQKREKVKT